MNLSVRFSNAKQMKQVVARAITCSIMLLVPPSRGIPNLRHAEPGPDRPESFNGATSSENSSQVAIEVFFNDPMLTSLIDQALVGNQELKILAEDVQIASHMIMARQGAYLPFVSIGAGAGLNRASLYTLEGALDHQLYVLPGRHFFARSWSICLSSISSATRSLSRRSSTSSSRQRRSVSTRAGS
jgi:outer membrane protein, multidrug efflux system